MKIFLTAFAKKQIQTVYYYYKTAASVEVANKIRKEINDAIYQLEKFPESGQVEESMYHFGKRTGDS